MIADSRAVSDWLSEFRVAVVTFGSERIEEQ
jgi:hypothetical protein